MLRIVYFGTPQFSATVLDFLLKQKVQIVACITKPDKPQKRSKALVPSPVKVVAESHHIPLFQPLKASDPEFAEKELRPLNADLFIVVAYSEILKENLLAMPRLGCINVHASLLPKYRGAAPIQRCIMAGDKESGVTIMAMQIKLDAGGILKVAKTKINDAMTAGELSTILSHIGAEALWEVMEKVEKGQIQPVPQDSSKVTQAPKLTSDEGEIDWTQPAQTVHNHIRGVTPKPGGWCWIYCRGKKKRLLVIKAQPIESPTKNTPGTILPGPFLDVTCKEGGLRLLKIKLEGKKALAAEDFLRGISKDNLSFSLNE